MALPSSRATAPWALLCAIVAAVASCGLDLRTKTGCRHSSDCARDQVCIAWRCQPSFDGFAPSEASAGPDAVVPATDAGVDLQADAPESDSGPNIDESMPLGDLPPSRTPGELSGLAFWFDAAEGVSPAVDGQRVTSWLDRSSWKHQALARRTGPVFLADAGNGRPALSFALTNDDTVALYLKDHMSLRWGRRDFTLVAVLRHRNHPGHISDPRSYGIVYAKVESEVPPFYGPLIYANDPWPSHQGVGPTRTAFRFQTVAVQDSSVTSQTAGYDDGRLHLVLALRRQERLILRADGAQVGLNVVPIDDIDLAGIDGVIGANPTRVIQQLEGEVFELAAYDGTTADEELAGLERHLLDKYRIDTAPPRDR